MYNIQNNFGKYNKVRVCNTIKKILIGKLFTYVNNSKRPLIILAVRRNNLYGNLEMLVGEYNGYSICVCSWYGYHRNNIIFVGRDNSKSIRKCLKYNPKYISYHLGKSVNLSNVQVMPEPYKQPIKPGALPLYDNHNYYKDNQSLM